MNAEAFLDTNVLLYFVSKAEGERRKTERAASRAWSVMVRGGRAGSSSG